MQQQETAQATARPARYTLNDGWVTARCAARPRRPCQWLLLLWLQWLVRQEDVAACSSIVAAGIRCCQLPGLRTECRGSSHQRALGLRVSQAWPQEAQQHRRRQQQQPQLEAPPPASSALSAVFSAANFNSQRHDGRGDKHGRCSCTSGENVSYVCSARQRRGGTGRRAAQDSCRAGCRG